jgi:hypothetical protein
VHPTKPLGVLQRRRRRGHLRDRAQLRPRSVRALVGQVIEERAADELTLRQTDHQLGRRCAAAADLHRSCAALPPDLGVNRRDQVQLLGEIADHDQPTMPRQRWIIGANLDPSGTPDIVTHTHPLGGRGDCRGAPSSHLGH